MEGVVTKVRRDLSWDVYLRAGKHIPIHHPAWRIRATADVMRQIIDPIKEQLHEDAT